MAPTGRRRSVVLIGIVLIAGIVAAAPAFAAPRPDQVTLIELLRSTPSDPRAQFFDGNVVTCAAVGFTSSIQMGSPSGTDAADANVAGTVATNAGTVHPGEGQEVNVAITGSGVVIDAVVVKGGDGYNLYADAAVLPPMLAPPQHYISPLNGGGNVPTISHWFVCYHVTTPPPVGALIVDKTVIPPAGPPATPLPTSYSAIVNCDDGVHTNIPVTFNFGGGRGAGSIISGIAAGTVCTVVEATAGLPPGTTIAYDPPGADTTGVTISASTAVSVDIVNDFSGLTPQSGNLQLVKAVLPGAPGVTLPSSYLAHVACDDGTQADVTLPGTGGTGTPLLSPTAGALCAVAEDMAGLPPGWSVTYSVSGRPPVTTPPVFTITGNETVTVTITNDPSAVVPPPPPTTGPATSAPTTPPSVAPTEAPVLPPTGDTPAPLITVSLALLALGIASTAFGFGRWRSRWTDDA